MQRLLFSLIGIWVCWQSVYSQTATVDLSFNELTQYVNAHSPIAEQLNQLLDLNKVERKIALSWNNPSIDYSEEALDNNGVTEREQLLALSKQIEMPWTYALRRQGWNAFEKAAALSHKQRMNEFLGDVKTGYVELQSFNNYIEQLNRFKLIINEISEIAKNQAAEGTISVFDYKLIQMALFNLQAKLIEVGKQKNNLEGEWKTKIGIDRSQKLNLKSEISFREIQLKSAQEYASQIINTAGMQMQRSELRFLDKMVQLESGNFIPSLDLSAGLKRFADGQDGYTFGVSMPIPIFSSNLTQARKYKIERSIKQTEIALYERTLKNRIQMIVDEINLSSNLLRENQSLFESGDEFSSNISFNYQQGAITINDVLNTVQVYTETIENYYDQLNHYYKAVFSLEAEFNEILITF
jgi:outer membrane protein TolC